MLYCTEHINLNLKKLKFSSSGLDLEDGILSKGILDEFVISLELFWTVGGYSFGEFANDGLCLSWYLWVRVQRKTSRCVRFLIMIRKRRKDHGFI